MSISRLDCRTCGTGIQGSYSFSGLSQLTPEQIHFVETFIRCEGKFNRMEKEMDLSYPTLRARLQEVIQAMGFPLPGEKTGISAEDRAAILDRISRGELSAADAMSLLEN